MQSHNEQSPLELYQTAYNLHYRQKKISSACLVYERIIRDFPQSDAAAYASVQLHKIQANETLRKLARGRQSSAPLIALTIVNFLLVAAGLAFGAYHFKRISDAVNHQSIIARALGKMYAGQDDIALEMLNDLKILAQGDVTPYALAAEIHRGNNRFLQARKEFETFSRLYPDHDLPALELSLIDKEQDAYHKRLEAEREAEQARIEQKPAPTTRAKPRRRRTPPRKPRLLIDPDSITYF
jgi:TolA-binding protein